jgi:hypothetical protein
MSEKRKEDKFKEACPESAKILEKTQNPRLDAQLSAKLSNTAWQRGLAWRKEKIEAIAEARRRGISEKEIFKQLKMCGLADLTARKLMDDAFFCGDVEP